MVEKHSLGFAPVSHFQQAALRRRHVLATGDQEKPSHLSLSSLSALQTAAQSVGVSSSRPVTVLNWPSSGDSGQSKGWRSIGR